MMPIVNHEDTEVPHHHDIEALEKAEYIILINYTKDKIEGYSFSFPFSWLVTF
jgi:hypothetical protein